MSPEARKLRRDAAENLDRLLDAATEVFAEEGFGASIETVARRSGMGLGTIYRRFQNKEALIEELARRLLGRAVEIGERHLGDRTGGGLFGYLWEIGELLASQSGIVGRMWNVADAEELISRSRAAQASLLQDAQDAGAVRAELVPEDIAVVCWSVSGVLDVTRGLPPVAWRRHLELCIEGLRSTTRALAEAPLTATEMDEVIFGKSPR